MGSLNPFKSPKPAPVPVIQAAPQVMQEAQTPPTAENSADELKEAAAKERRRLLASGGRGATIKTGALGVTNGNSGVVNKTLLGG